MLPKAVLPSGETVPALGQGTWMMAERGGHKGDVAALRLGVELGMTLIDTAEMYGEGKVESLVGEAVAGIRDKVFLVSKVYPHNASRKGVAVACTRSLRRLNTDRLDLYLVHWRGNIRLEETVAGFEDLKRAGKIRHWGVSNFDTSDMEELFRVPAGGACAANQILYNLARRGCEYELTPWLERHRIPVMAYSPFEQGRLQVARALEHVAGAHNATPYQIAIAWLLGKPNTIVIPKSGCEAHVRENRKAADIRLTKADLDALDGAYKPPCKRKSLDVI